MPDTGCLGVLIVLFCFVETGHALSLNFALLSNRQNKHSSDESFMESIDE